MLSLEHGTKKYVGNTIFENVSLHFEPGNYYTLTGPNGSGKSTLMSCLLQHESLTEGKLSLNGTKVRAGHKDFAREVFGINDAIGWMPGITVGEHLELLRANTIAMCQQAVPTAHEALEELGVPQAYDRQPYALSSGQEQRSRLASLLLRPARYYFLDEPEKRLDVAGVQWIADWAHNTVNNGAMVCLATHDSALNALPETRNIAFPLEQSGGFSHEL